jgi:hypothetical protein
VYTHAFPFDPAYDSEAARWIRDAVQELTSYEVVPGVLTGDRLLEIDRRNQVIRIQEGQPFRRFHHLVDRACLFVVGGSDWAPEFRTRTNLRLVTAPEPAVGGPCPSCQLPGG